MFCRKCGQEIKEGARFCVKCGTPVPQTTAQPAAAPQESRTTAQPAAPSQPEPKVQNAAQQPAKDSSRKKGGNGIVIALICVIVIALAALIGVGTFYLLDRDVSESSDRDRDDEDSDRDKSPKDDSEEEDLDMDLFQWGEGTSESAEEIQSETVAEEDGETASQAKEKETLAEKSNADNAEETVAQEKPHEYRIVVKDVTWTQAYQEAKSVENGYLVNINSEEEWNTIMELIKAEQKEECIFWLGAVRRGESQDYFWVDAQGNSVGDSLNGNAHWLSGEPTYYDAENDIEERYMDMFYMSSEDRWVWNDTPDDLISLVSYYSGRVAYIVEIENE